MTTRSGHHVCHIADLTTPEIDHILDNAENHIAAAQGRAQNTQARGKVLASLFFEPSTRTRLSFESAMQRLGGGVITVADAGGSSITKGETLTDTIRMVAGYADAIVLRHPLEGAARLAASVSEVPIINAGDGAGQHPTQTLTDLFTIRKEKGDLANQTIVLAGDLKYGRTVHSLAFALARYQAHMIFVAPANLQMPADLQQRLKNEGAQITTAERLEDAVNHADVLYMTRIQKERFPDLDEYNKTAGIFRVTRRLLAEGKKDITVMHPLPRVDEIAPDVDDLPNAAYFRQAAYGVPVRMSLLTDILNLEVSA